ncbi:LacI family DNA-binding transcriptional regulator [uncultured Roseobacter sp.]|uniref:LacI family DNA-binding transcriptional regulator n=1 Tax=uncultured Roseobacter sp. TaxID=114847 RepID=UPI00262E2B47|nr:LacI family DNA-binding transcriptional regulator [uncultured Roseobacter sp.]
MVKRTKVTSIDVARHAGVSQSAVSRAFSRVPTQSGVSANVKKKIFQAANELGYRPNAIARSLITQRSNIVALLFSYLDNQFYALALEKLCIELQERGFHALVFMMPSTDTGEAEAVSELLEYQVDGIITASVELSSTLCAFCVKHDIPIVMFNRFQDHEGISSVTTDNVAGGRIAARHFVETGHKRISLLSGWQGSSTSRDRQFGFEAELRDKEVALFSHEVGHFDLELAKQAALKMFADPDGRPDALFVANDYMAIEVMSTLRQNYGLEIPKDFSVIGFDDTPIAALPEFSLTTLRQPINQLVASSVRLMNSMIKDGMEEIENIALAPKFIERGSVKSRH